MLTQSTPLPLAQTTAAVPTASATANTPPAALSRRTALRLFGLTGLAAGLGTSLATAPRLTAAEPTPTAPGPTPAPAAATLPPPATARGQTGVYRFRIGEWEALALNDGGITAPPSESPFAAGVTDGPAQIKAVLDQAFLPTAKIQVPFNNLLVRIRNDWVLFDAGCGPLYGAQGGHLVAQLAAAGLTPGDIAAVFISHLHGDHMGGLLHGQTGELVFPKATHYLSKTEADFWSGSSPDLAQLPIGAQVARELITGAQDILRRVDKQLHLHYIAPGERILDGLEIIDAPGHTAGHLAFLLSSGQDQLLHFVDAAHHHELSFAHPEWSFAYDAQPAVAVATRRRLLDRAAADRLRVFGTHMPFPALGHVRATDKTRYSYQIEAWQVG